MLPAPRRYQGEQDLDRMCALLQAGRAAGIASYYIHTGDLKWWLYYPPLGSSWWEHIYLWEDPADSMRLLGWALIAPDGETFDVYCQPNLYGSAVAGDMYTWAEESATQSARQVGEKQIGAFWIIPEDNVRTCWLEDRGYRITYQDVALTKSLAEPIPDPIVPEGYQIRPSRGLEEVKARARAQYGAFRSKAPFEQYVERFTRFMQSPVYDPEADLVAAAPDGRIASFCITWSDSINREGLFEPVGTHPDFQRKGLGRAVMLAALLRLQEQGMDRAIVCTGEQNTPAVQLYQSVGFRQYSTFRFYGKYLTD